MDSHSKITILPPGMQITAPIPAQYESMLTAPALVFAAKLLRGFESRRQQLLTARKDRQKSFDSGVLPDYLGETAHIRAASWSVGAIPTDLQDRRVEITGPAGDRKMVINALNSGAKAFMADFEDSMTPNWENVLAAQQNMYDAIRRTISFQSGEKQYKLSDSPAVLIPRPRGWHLNEKHVLIDGKPVSGGIFDFAIYFFHNAKELLARGSGPYFYLPKMESHLEARLWNDIFVMAQHELGVPQGTIKTTVLIEVILSAFEMDEILYELRDHCIALNIGRWDYIFSAIKKFRLNKDFCLADRSQVTMTSPFMRAYALSLVKTCHKRNAQAIGGMAAFIPIKGDAAANEAVMEKVRADKTREVTDGCDGTWVAHPGLVPVAMEVFNKHMPTPNQVARKRDDLADATQAQLLDFKPEAPISKSGLRNNLQVGIQYIGQWLAGNGCVAIFNLMEDAATAEISRSQVWQWIRSAKGKLEDGRKIDLPLVMTMIDEELKKCEQMLGAAYAHGEYAKAAQMFKDMCANDEYVEFLTLPAYEAIA
jgi:malate synthase